MPKRRLVMFGEMVKARRAELGLTLREFCRRLGEDPSNWSKIERGILRPPVSREKLRRIAGVLGISEGSAEWEGLVDVAVIGSGEIPSYVMENREVYGTLPELFRTIGGDSLTAEEIRRMVERLKEGGLDDTDGVVDERTERKAIVVAGPNGAGKTTFVREYLVGHDIPYISADAIAESMTGGDIRDVALSAGKMFFAELRDAVSAGRSFAVETTLSGMGFRRLLNAMKQERYGVSIIFIYLDNPGFCVTRIVERTRRGGHHVPEGDVVRRFHRSVANFWEMYRFEADDWHLVCNTAQEFIEVARGCGGERLVFDPESCDTLLESEGLSDEK
jgi:predicted ABC-type ATPase/transcriptional regulator with XRE-family HTH domain